MAFAPGGSQDVNVQVQAQGTNQFTSAFSNMVGSMMSFKAATVAVGGALAFLAGSAIAKSISAARDWNAVMREFQKVMDPTTAREVGDAIVELGQEIPLATTELGTIAAEAARFGIEGAENISMFTEAVAKMAFATDISVDEAGSALAKLLTLTETSTDQIENLGSAINTLGQTAATSAGEVVEGMLRSAAALNQLGLTAPQIAGLQASLNEVSESARRAGTRLRRLAQEMQDPQRLTKIATAFVEIGRGHDSLSDEVRNAENKLAEENAELSRLEQQLIETSAELRGLGEAHDQLGDSIEENRIKIEEIRLEAAKEGRELTEEEKARIEELELANREMRLEQMKTARQMDETRETREKQQEAVDEQKAAVEELSSELDAVKTESAERLRKQWEQAPLETIEMFAALMDEGGKEADVLRENLRSVSRQALAGLGQNLDRTAEGTGDLTDNVRNASRAFEEGTSLQREYEIEAGSLGAEIQRLRNSLSSAGVVIGNEFIPLIKATTIAIRGTTEAFRSFVDAGNSVKVAAGLVSAALAGLAVSVGVVSTPIGILVGLVALLATAWATNFGNIRSVTEQTFGRIAELWDIHMGELFGPEGTATVILNEFAEFWRMWGDEISGVAEFVFDIIGGTIVTAFDFILTVMVTFLRLMTGDWRGAFEAMAGFAERTLDGLVNFASEWGGRFYDALLRNLPPGLRDVFASVFGGGGGGGRQTTTTTRRRERRDRRRRGGFEPRAAGRGSVAETAGVNAPRAPGAGAEGRRQVREVEHTVTLKGEGAITDEIARQTNEELRRERRAADRRRGKPRFT